MKHRDRLSLFERLASRAKTHTWFNPLGLHNECWTWCGSKCNKGYGHIRVAGKTMRVHIAAWELAKGRRVRPGYTLDHGCRNKACWRPSHMEEVTRGENTARGNRANPRSTEKARAAKRARKGIDVVIHNAGLLRDAFHDAAAKFERAGPLFKL